MIKHGLESVTLHVHTSQRFSIFSNIDTFNFSTSIYHMYFTEYAFKTIFVNKFQLHIDLKIEKVQIYRFYYVKNFPAEFEYCDGKHNSL